MRARHPLPGSPVPAPQAETPRPGQLDADPDSPSDTAGRTATFVNGNEFLRIVAPQPPRSTVTGSRRGGGPARSVIEQHGVRYSLDCCCANVLVLVDLELRMVQIAQDGTVC